MPKVLPVYLENRRQQILDAAAACFARGGFHRTTMHDICGEAELSPGAVYRYFGSKEDIILAMCDRGHEDDVATIRAAMDLGDTKSAFGELIRIYFSGVDDHEYCALMVELLSEAPRNEEIGESLRQGWVNIMAPMTDLVAQAQARGEIEPELDPSAVATVMLGVYQGLVVQHLINPDMDVEGYAAVTRALFAGSFCCSETGDSNAESNTQAALRH